MRRRLRPFIRYASGRVTIAAGLVLLVAALAASSALAKAGGTDRPLKYRAEGFNKVNVSTGVIEEETLYGHATHMGKTVETVQGHVTLTGPTTFSVVLQYAIEAANGDIRAGDCVGSGKWNASITVAEAVWTCTANGGLSTGRFEGVTGLGTVHVHIERVAVDGPIFTNHIFVEATGKISY